MDKMVFVDLLQVLFIGLKLGGVIQWSWWWVMAPLWGGFALWVTVVAIIMVIASAFKPLRF